MLGAEQAVPVFIQVVAVYVLARKASPMRVYTCAAMPLCLYVTITVVIVNVGITVVLPLGGALYIHQNVCGGSRVQLS